MLRQVETLSINVFIEHCFHNRLVTSLISGWRIEPSELKEIVANYLREMGIYFVAPFQSNLLLEKVIFVLKNSKEIKGLVKKAEMEELKRQQSRHATL